MLPLEYYEDKAQTYIKHFFLEKYLERVARNIFSWKQEFIYVDVFAGPWRSEHEQHQDTSFAIAIKLLKNVTRSSFKPGKPKSLKCFFVEKNNTAFNDLKDYLSSVKGVEYHLHNGEFETAIPKIVDYVSDQFSFCFIDPTGFSGFGMDAMQPILDLRGEFLINFMYNFINKHLENTDSATKEKMDRLFGGGSWREEIAAKIKAGVDREDAIVEVYCERLKKTGKIKYVTSTRILFGTKDRTYFYLVYGTNHRKGLVEFRNTESKTVEEQQGIRSILKYKERESKSGAPDLLAEVAPIDDRQRSFDELRRRNLSTARDLVLNILQRANPTFDDCLDVLEIPYIWRSDIKDILLDLKGKNLIKLVYEKPMERVPKEGTKIIWIS